jgi:hypothetical protein
MEQYYGRLQAVSTREIWAQLGCEQPDSGSVEGGQAYPHGALARLSGDLRPLWGIYMAAGALRDDVSRVGARHSTRLLWLFHEILQDPSKKSTVCRTTALKLGLDPGARAPCPRPGLLC